MSMVATAHIGGGNIFGGEHILIDQRAISKRVATRLYPCSMA